MMEPNFSDRQRTVAKIKERNIHLLETVRLATCVLSLPKLEVVGFGTRRTLVL